MNRTRTKRASWIQSILTTGITTGATIAATTGVILALGLLFVPISHAAPKQAQVSGTTASAAQALPAPGTVTRQVARTQGGRVTLLGGVLTAPSSATPAAIAAVYLSTQPAVLAGVDPASLTLDKVTSFHRGHALRYRQTHKGLPVIGGTTIVRMDEHGRVRWIGSEGTPIPGNFSTTPAMSARQALSLVGRALAYPQAYVDGLALDNTTRLAIYTQPNMREPRLAYWIELPLDMTRMQTWRAFVDAETGYIYRLENKVVSGLPGAPEVPTCEPGTHRAYVYEHNPVESPDLECVSLSDMLPANATALGNDDVATGNCVDNNNCRTIDLGFPLDVHWCDDAPTAKTNPAGDFTDHAFVGHTELDDAFSEVQMFYHVNKAYEVARSLGGFTNLSARPLGAIVNFRPPIDITSDDLFGDLLAQSCTGATYTGGQPLYNFDNAFFVPAGGFLGYPDRDSIVFGQGSEGDFAYDGDVIAHEFGHAVMSTVAPDLSFGFIDEYGFNPTPGGMHEGYADLMTMFVTNDPEVGEYVGQSLGFPDIRNMANSDTCPASIIGESHEDSLPLTGAFWAARQAVATTNADRRAFDEAVFAAQQTFTESEDFTSAAAKTVMEIEAALGPDAAATVQNIFSNRGLDGCQNRVAEGTAVKEFLIVGTSQSQVGGNFPAPVQFRYDLPGGADSIKLDIEASQVFALGGLGGQPSLGLGIKEGQEIHWSLAGGALQADYTDSMPVTIDQTSSAGTATFQGPFAPGTYYLQLYSQDGALILKNTRLSHTGGQTAEPDAGVEPTPDAGVEPAPDAGGGNNDGDGGGGCAGCAAGTSPGQTSGAILLGLLTLGAIMMRRRRRI